MSGDAARLAELEAEHTALLMAYMGQVDEVTRMELLAVKLLAERDHARSIAVSLENELAEQAYQRHTEPWITAADYEEGWHD